MKLILFLSALMFLADSEARDRVEIVSVQDFGEVVLSAQGCDRGPANSRAAFATLGKSAYHGCWRVTDGAISFNWMKKHGEAIRVELPSQMEIEQFHILKNGVPDGGDVKTLIMKH